jgi:3-hydroxyisobutyrate dehydrogenase-like beta-hydroxyacid dehydrogenase
MRNKLVNNYLAIVSCAFNAVALTLSQRFGLSLEKTLDVVHGTTAANGQLRIAWATKVDLTGGVLAVKFRATAVPCHVIAVHQGARAAIRRARPFSRRPCAARRD